jgi:hypothetical protein
MPIFFVTWLKTDGNRNQNQTQKASAWQGMPADVILEEAGTTMKVKRLWK